MTKAEKYLVENWRSKFNPLLDKANRSIEQYTFDDVVEIAEGFAKSQLTERENEIKHIKAELTVCQQGEGYCKAQNKGVTERQRLNNTNT